MAIDKMVAANEVAPGTTKHYKVGSNALLCRCTGCVQVPITLEWSNDGPFIGARHRQACFATSSVRLLPGFLAFCLSVTRHLAFFIQVRATEKGPSS